MKAVAQEKDREVTVRRLAAGEESQFLSLADGYYQAMSALGVPGMKPTLDTFLEGFSRWLIQRMEEPHSVVLVALIDLEIVGAMIGTQHTTTGWQDPELLGVIEWIYVSEPARKHHIAALLVAALEVFFKAAGIKKIIGFIWWGNLIPKNGALQRGYSHEAVMVAKEL